MQKFAEHFGKDFGTKFEVINDDVIFSKDRRIYVRKCLDEATIERNKHTMVALVEDRREPKVVFIDDGYCEELKLHFMVYR